MLQTNEHDLFYPISKSRRPLEAPTQPPITRVPVNISTTVKVPACQVDHSHLSSAKVKKEWTYTSTFLIRFHSVDRDNNIYIHIIFTFNPVGVKKEKRVQGLIIYEASCWSQDCGSQDLFLPRIRTEALSKPHIVAYYLASIFDKWGKDKTDEQG